AVGYRREHRSFGLFSARKGFVIYKWHYYFASNRFVRLFLSDRNIVKKKEHIPLAIISLGCALSLDSKKENSS
ncbi:MAG: hypothetical protein IJ733_19345, partial [Lachnospiraceae bacterium]|nr:hypothetical protein [Lachnospiraceae bacterium]